MQNKGEHKNVRVIENQVQTISSTFVPATNEYVTVPCFVYEIGMALCRFQFS